MPARINQPASRFSIRQNADINVTPFVDVMLVLLIIFMVAAPLPTVSWNVEIPPPPTTPLKNPRPPTVISIAEGGRLSIGQTPTDGAHLIVDVVAALASPKPTAERVMIRADKAVPYRDLMDVMNRLQTAGFNRVGLVSEAL